MSPISKLSRRASFRCRVSCEWELVLKRPDHSAGRFTFAARDPIGLGCSSGLASLVTDFFSNSAEEAAAAWMGRSDRHLHALVCAHHARKSRHAGSPGLETDRSIECRIRYRSASAGRTAKDDPDGQRGIVSLADRRSASGGLLSLWRQHRPQGPLLRSPREGRRSPSIIADHQAQRGVAATASDRGKA